MKGAASALFVILCVVSPSLPAAADTCPPTQPDALGPFYRPGAPERRTVGKGYVLSGKVKSSRDCSPVRGAKLEFWLIGPDGHYDEDRRATVYADDAGNYWFESNYPKPYGGRPPHIHIRASADGFTTVVTQHYPEQGRTQTVLDLVLIPSGK